MAEAIRKTPVRVNRASCTCSTLLGEKVAGCVPPAGMRSEQINVEAGAVQAHLLACPQWDHVSKAVESPLPGGV